MATVSVIIPVYNMDRYIQETIQSVLDQTYPIHEIIIVDDESTDQSVSVCQEFNDSRIHIIRQNNRGPSGALNTGIRRATGEFIAFLDGDDKWLPTKIETHIQHLERSPSVGISFSHSSFIDLESQPLQGRQAAQLNNIDIAYLMRYNPLGNGSAAVYRRQVLDDIQFQQCLHRDGQGSYFDEELRMSQDIELLRRVALKTAWTIEGLPLALTLYRINPNSVSSNFDKKVKVWQQLFLKTCALNPELIASYQSISKAYELKYLARRAIRLRHGSAALQLIRQALQSDWTILLEEPKKVLAIALASVALCLMPKPLYGRLETVGMALKV